MIHIIYNGFFHIRGICIIIIEDQLVKTIAGLSFYIVVKFQLKAVPICIRITCDRGKTCISLWPDSHRIKGLAVYHHITGIIFLRNGIFQHFLPVLFLHQNIDIHNLLRIKQLTLIFHSHSVISVNRLKFSRKSRSHKAQDHSQSHDYRCNFCYVFICNHAAFPPVRTYTARYSLPKLHFPHRKFHSDDL